MKLGQVNRLRKLEKLHADDVLCQLESVIGAIYRECPEAAEAAKALRDYVLRFGPQPPRFYQYDEDEGMRRILWALAVDQQAQSLNRHLDEVIEVEIERRTVEGEQQAKDELLTEWMEYLEKDEPGLEQF
jgi:hypothetical protein